MAFSWWPRKYRGLLCLLQFQSARLYAARAEQQVTDRVGRRHICRRRVKVLRLLTSPGGPVVKSSGGTPSPSMALHLINYIFGLTRGRNEGKKVSLSNVKDSCPVIVTNSGEVEVSLENTPLGPSDNWQLGINHFGRQYSSRWEVTLRRPVLFLEKQKNILPFLPFTLEKHRLVRLRPLPTYLGSWILE